MRTPLRALAAASMTALLAACGSSTEPRHVDPEVLEAVATLDRIADSLSTLGVDAATSDAYHALANVVRGDPGVSRVIISVDGTPAEFFATAQSFDQNYCPPGGVCPAIYRPPLNSMVAWQRNDPRRVVQLTADGALFPIGSVPPGVSAPFASRATLTYLDGAGGVFIGVGGTQSITMSPPTDEPCAGPRAEFEALSVQLTSSALICKRAEFNASFSGVVQPPAFALRKNSATGTHTVAMAAQPVPGTFFTGSFCNACGFNFPPFRPPIAILGNSSVLQPNLRATAIGRDVALEFTVRNTSLAPVLLEFTSGQQYDFIVRSGSGAVVWRWAREMGFVTMLTSRTLAPGETALFTEHWQAPAAGVYGAEAMLTSSSHRAAASAAVVVP